MQKFRIYVCVSGLQNVNVQSFAHILIRTCTRNVSFVKRFCVSTKWMMPKCYCAILAH